MTDTENFNKMLEGCKKIEVEAKAKAEREGLEAYSLIYMSNNPELYCEAVWSIVYKEFPKNDDIINKQYEQEVIDNIKTCGKNIYDAGGMKMMLICFNLIISLAGRQVGSLMYDNSRRVYQSFVNMCWDGVGEWYG